jgi:hypothetical protein
LEAGAPGVRPSFTVTGSSPHDGIEKRTDEGKRRQSLESAQSVERLKAQ